MPKPSTYDPKYAELGYNYALLGAIDTQIAEFLGIATSTYYNWRREHDYFRERIDEGKVQADALIVQSLFHNAQGFEHDDVHISNYKGEITETNIRKRYPPNVTAQIFWLKNRQPALWRDKKEIGGDVNVSLKELLDEIDGTETGLPVDDGSDYAD